MKTAPLAMQSFPNRYFPTATDAQLCTRRLNQNEHDMRSFYVAILGHENAECETRTDGPDRFACHAVARGKATLPPVNHAFGAHRMYLALCHVLQKPAAMNSVIAEIEACQDIEVYFALQPDRPSGLSAKPGMPLLVLQHRITRFFVALNVAGLLLASDGAHKIDSLRQDDAECIYGYRGMHATFAYNIATVALPVLKPLAALVNKRDTNNLYWMPALRTTLRAAWECHADFRAACSIHFPRIQQTGAIAGMTIGLPYPTMIMAYNDGGACVFQNDVTRDIRLTAENVVSLANDYLDVLHASCSEEYECLAENRISYLHDLNELAKVKAAWKSIPEGDTHLDADFKAAIDDAQRVVNKKKREELAERDVIDAEYVRVMAMDDELTAFLRQLKSKATPEVRNLAKGRPEKIAKKKKHSAKSSIRK